MKHGEHEVQQPRRRFSVHQSLMTLVLMVSLSIVSPSAWAMLVMQIDPGNMTVSFGGEETAALSPEMGAPGSGEGFSVWGISGTGGTNPGSLLLPGGVNVLTATGTPSTIDFGFVIDNTSTRFLLNLNIAPYPDLIDPNVTVTGTGTPFSYASLNPANKAFFESLIGQSLPVNSGGPLNTFSPIQVNQVPAPSAMLLLGSGLLGMFGWRWWNGKKV